jgi:lysophospholipid acyltransferase (LPLAT)-like uncharacterized protein
MIPMSREPKTKRAPASGPVIPHKPTFLQQSVGWFIYLLLRGVPLTLRCRWTDRSGYFDIPPVEPAIYCVWHNRLALSMFAYFGYVKSRNRTAGMAALVSASKDGGFLTAILQRFGVQPVRGSSSRRGPQALLELTSWAERGYDLAITPDGPRGPRYKVQDGVMILAQVTGLPIIPVSYQLGWKIRINSWDRFLIPLPFSRCEMIYEKPVRVPRDASDQQCELLRQELENRLRAISAD